MMDMAEETQALAIVNVHCRVASSSLQIATGLLKVREEARVGEVQGKMDKAMELSALQSQRFVRFANAMPIADPRNR